MSCEVCLGHYGCPCCSDDGEPSCGGEGRAADCEGCEDCIVEVRRGARLVTARAPRTDAGRARRARNGIQPGDRVWVTEGFTFQVGGARTGYFRKERAVK